MKRLSNDPGFLDQVPVLGLSPQFYKCFDLGVRLGELGPSTVGNLEGGVRS